MHSYDVALWSFWPALFPEWTEEVQAYSSQSAIYELMRLHGLHFVEKAAVSDCNGSAMQRYYGVICRREMEVFSHD